MRVLTSLTNTSLTLRLMYALHMLSYDHQGGGGGVLTSLTSTSLTLRLMYTLHMLSYDHQGGGGGVLTYLTSTSPTLYGTCTRCACCRMIIRGVGVVNVLDEHFRYVTAHVA